jgi:hypothetical protein
LKFSKYLQPKDKIDLESLTEELKTKGFENMVDSYYSYYDVNSNWRSSNISPLAKILLLRNYFNLFQEPKIPNFSSTQAQNMFSNILN